MNAKLHGVVCSAPYRCFYTEHGESLGRNRLLWMNTNYGYVASALAVISNTSALEASHHRELAKKAFHCALLYGDPASTKNCSALETGSATNDRVSTLFDKNEDLRPVAAMAYVSTKPHDFGDPLCMGKQPDDQTCMENKISKLLRNTEPYTVNSQILIESQLRGFYATADKEAPKECTQRERSPHEEHSAQTYLLAALREYRTGKFEKAVKYTEAALDNNHSCKLRPLMQLANSFVVSTWEEQPDKNHKKEAETDQENDATKRIKRAQDDLNRLVEDKGSGELYWRARSLDAVRKAMCLNEPKQPATCSLPKDAATLLERAREASNAIPGNAYLHANLGIMLLRAHDSKRALGDERKEALREFRSATVINPGDPWLRCLLAQALRIDNLGDMQDAHTQEQFGRMLDPKRWDDYQKEIRRVWPALVSH